MSVIGTNVYSNRLIGTNNPQESKYLQAFNAKNNQELKKTAKEFEQTIFQRLMKDVIKVEDSEMFGNSYASGIIQTSLIEELSKKCSGMLKLEESIFRNLSKFSNKNTDDLI